MKVQVITLPYHLDREGEGTGAGPARLLEAGLEQAIASAGHEVVGVESVRREGDHGHETGNIFANIRALAQGVRTAHEQGAFPLVLAGDCYNAIGVAAGLAARDPLGVLWLDAHGDANTPETTTSGFFDGFGLAVLLGWCWRALAGTVPGHSPLEAGHVVHLGGRAFDLGEREAMLDSGVTILDAPAMRAPAGAAAIEEALCGLSDGPGGVHVHLDLDVIDRADGIASRYATDGGPSLRTLTDTLSRLPQLAPLTSVSVCAYDPAFDGDGRAGQAALRLIEALLSASGRSV